MRPGFEVVVGRVNDWQPENDVDFRFPPAAPPFQLPPFQLPPKTAILLHSSNNENASCTTPTTAFAHTMMDKECIAMMSLD